MAVKTKLTKWRSMLRVGVEVICGICDEPIGSGGDKDKGHLTVDHIIPKSLGGGNENSNLQPAHSICNRLRSNTILHEFKGALKSKEKIVKRAVEIIDRDKVQKKVGKV